MKIVETKINGVFIIEPKVYMDNRGFFFESFNHKQFCEGIGKDVNFKQDNHSRSQKGVLRGLHFQNSPHEQGKLVRCTKGEVFDVVVDLRAGSESFGNWYGTVLSEDNKKQLWIPEGCAHGFMTLSDEADFQYKTTDYYHPESEFCIIWNDADLDIRWPSGNVTVSEKDNKGSSFKAWVEITRNAD
ncbi:dTDP-4-dehydrorhamnose 3,5-epimerase [Erwinia aphidicola]|uniref:dTDP-4-dehydrorhamnose 3,5-epimerase n=1 Tax=Erwinia aphidicola TaxID=68334 RepID=UPI003D262A72